MKGSIHFLYIVSVGLLVVTALLVLYFVRLHQTHVESDHSPGGGGGGGFSGRKDAVLKHFGRLGNGGGGSSYFGSGVSGGSGISLPDNHPVVVQSEHNIENLLALVRIQNETILALERLLYSKGLDADNVNIKKHVESSSVDNSKSIALSSNSCPTCPTCSSNSNSDNKISVNSNSKIPYVTGSEQTCESQYGLELVGSWQQARQVWCVGEIEVDGRSQPIELVCYPYLQKHKAQDGRGADMFCEAKNVIIDFSKVDGQTSVGHKPPKGGEYLTFSPGSLVSSCRKTPFYKEHQFMPHHSLLMRTFQDSAPPEDVSQLQRESKATYLLARDEDCENPFHSTADFMNMYLVYNILGLDFKNTQVMLFDKYPDGAFAELMQMAYAGGSELHRHSHYNRRRVLFERLVFHLESPAGLIFPRVAIPNPLRCYSTSLFQAYRRHILQSFDLLDVEPPAIPFVTLSVRRRSEAKNVGRVLANEHDVYSIIKQGNLINHKVIDGSKLSFREHLTIIRNTNVLVGVHGAGLMMIMFAAEEAVLVEAHPSYRQDRHFRHAARMTGKIYMPLRSRVRETCLGTSDNVVIPLEEFRTVIDGAVRLARVFDRGLVECGLVCPGEILSIDSRLDNYYKPYERKQPKINTMFPC